MTIGKWKVERRSKIALDNEGLEFGSSRSVMYTFTLFYGISYMIYNLLDSNLVDLESTVKMR